ncbi:MAG: glycoside hydrolase family 27 protein, partial [Acidobacteriota bacterium]
METRIRCLLLTVLAAAIISIQTPAGDLSFDDLAKTPPMGWNSWNKFACNVSETLIKETSDA